MNILIVDDHASNLKQLRAQLEMESHTVLEAANGVEALQVLERESVGAVISDTLMPNMDGFRLCREIRKSEKFNSLPFILYTSAYTSPEDRQLAKLVGADRYVVKPAPARAIFDALHDAANKVRLGAPVDSTQDESYVLRPYSETLVDKLEEKNAELQETLRKLQAAHREIVALNRELELRVEQRTGELQEANRELESFSYWVSHDLRATLRAMAGFTSVVLRDHAGRLPLDATQLIARVEENVRGMAMLIDDLLDLARVGRKTLSPQRVNLAHVVRECLKELAHDQEGRAIDIAVGELPPCHGDLVLLKHVFANLLSNALKYTRKRQVARIEVGADTRNGQQLIFVRDNGAGFDTRHAHKLFEVFQRLHSQSEFPGTGVGLAIVKRAIEKHGGRVWAESAPDRGATFYLTLPAASPDVQPAR